MASGSLTRADIEAWSTEHLDTAATHWSSTAQAWEEHFTTIHSGMTRPGGTTWDGAGADAAAERSWADLVTVRGAADALHSASAHATTGSGDVAWAKRQALNAIVEAEEDGFTVGQDFSVKDTSMPPAASTTPRNGPPTFVWVFEAPNQEQPHSHWCLHLQPGQAQHFAKALRRWIKRVCKLPHLPDADVVDVCTIYDWTASSST